MADQWNGANWPQENIPYQFPQSTGAVFAPIFWDTQLHSSNLDPANAWINTWDVVQIAGFALPGISKVVPGCLHKKTIDRKKKKNSNGATLSFQGYESAEFTIKTRIWTEPQFQQLARMMAILNPPAPPITGPKKAQSAAVAPVQIYHPSLAIIGISSVVIEAVSPLFPTNIHGQWEMDTRCIHFIAPSRGDNGSTAKGTQNYGNQQTAIQADPASLAPKLPSQDPSVTGTKPTQ